MVFARKRECLYVCMKARTTPIAATKTQALARVLTGMTHGYTRVCTGTVPPEKLGHLATKFDAAYRIADTKGRRVINRREGRANTMFAAYSPPCEYLQPGERRHNDAGEVRWTWRRTKAEMTQLYAELSDDLARRRFNEVQRTLERIARRPGFHGVRVHPRLSSSTHEPEATARRYRTCFMYRKGLMACHSCCLMSHGSRSPVETAVAAQSCELGRPR